MAERVSQQAQRVRTGSGHVAARQGAWPGLARPSVVLGQQVQDVLRAPGQPLSAPLREEMEARLGADFSQVRVHTDSAARASAAGIGARAYTSGNHVVIAAAGVDRLILAHELAHVTQQREGPVSGTDDGSGLSLSEPSDQFERAAEAAAERALHGPLPRPGNVGGAPVAGGRSPTVPALPISEVARRSGQPLAPSAGQEPGTRANGDFSRIPDVQRSPQNPPFRFRYGYQGPNYMQTITSGSGGLVQYPQTGLPERMETETTQMSVVSGSTFEDLPSGGGRAVTQVAVMGGVSPNDAARQLGLPSPGPRTWEWLHLVAFSIGQTHISSFSPESRALVSRTGQPQQIRENLVLGSAATNTAMLSYETLIKRIMRAHRDWRLQLFVGAHKEDRQVQLQHTQAVVTIPVGTRIDYHFYFEAPGGVTPPVVLAFDLQALARPTIPEYAEVVNALEEHIKQLPALEVHGMRTTHLKDVAE